MPIPETADPSGPASARPDPGPRFASLDSLRGLAASWVFAHHIWQTLVPNKDVLVPVVRLSPARILLSAYPAVIFFFVLSGFVLAQPFVRGRPPGFLPFVVQRMSRIYVPMVVAVVLAALLAFDTGVAREGLAIRSLGEVATVVGRALLMTGETPDIAVNPVLWSLVIELRVSLVYGFLFAAAAAAGPAIALAGSAVLSLACVGYFRFAGHGFAMPLATEDVASSLVLSAQYVFPFVGGILVAIHLDRLKRAVESTAVRTLALAGAVLALGVPPTNVFTMFLYSVAASVLIAAVLASRRVSRVLEHGVLVTVGRSSYSLYLVHLPVILWVLDRFGQEGGFARTLALACAAVALTTAVFYGLVERPARRLGRALAALMPAGPVRAAAWSTATGKS